MRVNPFSLARPKREAQTRTFVDPLYPDRPVTLTLRPLSATEAYAALEHAQELIKRYVTGDEENDLPAMPFPAVGGESVQVSERLLIDMASLCRMQVEQAGEAPYTVEDLIALSEVMPTAFERIQEFALEVRRRGRRAEGNGSGARGEDISSASPSENRDDTRS